MRPTGFRCFLVASCISHLAIPSPAAPQVAGSQPCKMDVAQGFIELRRAQFERALARFDHALSGSPACVTEARLGKASTYNSLNDHKKALVEAQWVLGATDDAELLSEAHYQFGFGLHKRGSRMTQKKAEAEAAFRRAVDVSNGAHHGAIRALARLYRETRRDDDLAALQDRFADLKIRSRSEQRKLMERPRKPPPRTAAAEDKAAPEAADESTSGAAGDQRLAEAMEGATPGPTQLCQGQDLPSPEQEILHFGGPDGAEHQGYSKPEKIDVPIPGYTEKTRRKKIKGVVIYEVLIGPDGRVVQVEILKSLHPDLDQAVIHSSCQSLYIPAETPEGQPIHATLRLTTKFSVS